MINKWRNLTLSQQFKLACLGVLFVGMLTIGLWVGRQIERGVTNRTAAITALYVDSIISPVLQPLANTPNLSSAELAELNRLLHETPLGQQIVSFKVWLPDGTIVFATDTNLIDRSFAIGDSLSQALTGEVTAELTPLDEEEQASERQFADRLIEIYAPVRAQGSGRVIAVSEFYQEPGALIGEIRLAQGTTALVVGLGTLLMYLVLSGLANRAGQTIAQQQQQLETKVEQNARLRDRIRQAGGRTTTLNERFLRRISADLHDGPAQDLALALLRRATISENLERFLPPGSEKTRTLEDWQMVQAALESALDELRAISAGLRLPEIERLSGSEIVRRALRDHERKTGCQVDTSLDEIPVSLPLSVKMTLYRILQEALSNGYRHAGGLGQRVAVHIEGDELRVEVSDRGPGFDPQAIFREGHLGLATMHERAEVLGGCFNIESAPGEGTTIWSYLPLQIPEIPLPLMLTEMPHE